MIIDQVLKLWWENAADMKESAEFLIHRAKDGVRQSVVVSAMRSDEFNTTTKLKDIGELLKKIYEEKDTSKVSIDSILAKIQAIKDFHIALIREKLQAISSETIQHVLEVVDAQFTQFFTGVQKFIDTILNEENRFPLEEDYTISSETLDNGHKFSILGFWEILSAEIFSKLINELSTLHSKQVQSAVLDTTTLVDRALENKDEAFKIVSRRLWRRAMEILSEEKIAIIPGYVSWLPWWIEASIGRGYSDATAASVAVGLQNRNNEKEKKTTTQLHILKAVEWFLSIDPRIITKWVKPKLIRLLNYFTAREITGGASVKALHEQALREELQKAGIIVKLYDPRRPESPWTTISEEGDLESEWVMNVSGKDVITFSVNSSKMSGTWFLARVFSTVAPFASVGVVSTSETEITFTLDDTKENQAIAEKVCEALSIELWLKVKRLQGEKPSKKDRNSDLIILRDDISAVYCIWENMHDKVWLMADAAVALMMADINIEAESQAMMQRAMIFLVDRKDKNTAINTLHKRLVH